MKKQYIIYCSYPYSENPLQMTKEINAIARRIYELHHRVLGNELLLLIPHNIFDKVFEYPVGYSNSWMALCELTLISQCDALAYSVNKQSTGVTWEMAFAEKMGKPLITYEELMRGNVGGNVTVKMRKRKVKADEMLVHDTSCGMPIDDLPLLIAHKDCKFRKAIKNDAGKPMMDLVVPEFIVGIAKILTMGAQKYGTDNWKGDLAYNRIYAALQRHANAYHMGEHYDPESKASHMLHVACNAMFIYWYHEVNVELDYCPVCNKCVHGVNHSCNNQQKTFRKFATPQCFEAI